MENDLGVELDINLNNYACFEFEKLTKTELEITEDPDVPDKVYVFNSGFCLFVMITRDNKSFLLADMVNGIPLKTVEAKGWLREFGKQLNNLTVLNAYQIQEVVNHYLPLILSYSGICYKFVFENAYTDVEINMQVGL